MLVATENKRHLTKMNDEASEYGFVCARLIVNSICVAARNPKKLEIQRCALTVSVHIQPRRKNGTKGNKKRKQNRTNGYIHNWMKMERDRSHTQMFNKHTSWFCLN